MDYVLKRLLTINIIWYCAISAVYPLLYVSRERVKLRRIVLTDMQYEGNMLTLYILSL